jgi:hypothetical protein
MSVPLTMSDLEAQLVQFELGSTTPDCRAKILKFRQAMDMACDNGDITLKQWRTLVNRVSLIQEKCLSKEPDGWRHPSLRG